MFNVALKDTQDTFQLERGIAIPKSFHGNGRGLSHPVSLTVMAMQVGQSFFVPKGIKCAQSLAYGTAKKAGMKITIRKVEGGLRIWRIK